MSVSTRLVQGDCLECLPAVANGSVRLVYWDPPFFSQKVHRLSQRAGGREFSFSDRWANEGEYSKFIGLGLELMHCTLQSNGSLFFHCDRRATHIARMQLERVFGADNFRAEVIWTYRRWSNSKRALLPAHQTLFYFSKSAEYVFHQSYGDYSPATNVEQLLQKRVRDGRGKAVYERDIAGQVVAEGGKQGVPLSDVWDIPYLNPKAKERVGYPTQKPLLLLERIVSLTTDPGDVVLDPCCGSGTTLVAAFLLGRSAIGIDQSAEAIALSETRLANPIRTSSRLMQQGRQSYWRMDTEVQRQLQGLDCIPVQRHAAIDALLRQEPGKTVVPIRVQRPSETLLQCSEILAAASQSKKANHLIVIASESQEQALPLPESLAARVIVLRSLASQLQFKRRLDESQEG